MNLEIGKIIYRAETKNNILHQKRITMTDQYGDVWWRYDRPRREFRIEVIEIVGKTITTNFGVVPDYALNADPIDWYGKWNTEENDEVIEEYYFREFTDFESLEEAQAYIKQLEFQEAERNIV